MGRLSWSSDLTKYSACVQTVCDHCSVTQDADLKFCTVFWSRGCLLSHCISGPVAPLMMWDTSCMNVHSWHSLSPQHIAVPLHHRSRHTDWNSHSSGFFLCVQMTNTVTTPIALKSFDGFKTFPPLSFWGLKVRGRCPLACDASLKGNCDVTNVTRLDVANIILQWKLALSTL